MNNHGKSVKKLRKKYLLRGRREYCGKTREKFKRLCNTCQKKQNQNALRFVHKTRRIAFDAYGGRCICCGEKNVGFLTFDHIKNDGAFHRKISGCGTGYKFYLWLKAHNFPPKIVQVLCWNCNCGKRDNGGICPHKGLSQRNSA